MNEEFLEQIRQETRTAASELLDAAKLKPGEILAVGCSSSEIVGEKIGTCSSMEAAGAVFSVLRELTEERGLYLAAQCCEHLNRALVVEEACAEQYGLQIVNAIPWAHGGGAMGTTAYQKFAHPVLVSHIRAGAGMDIGGTLIGMHLKEVAVPFRGSVSRIGSAILIMARTRPPFVGGERARYDENLL